jgi:hypothetical protein
MEDAMRAAFRSFPSLPLFVALAALVLPAARAAAEDFDIDIPVDGTETVQPCSGEVVTLSGHMHFHATTNVTEDGDVFIAIHSETHGMTAVTSVNFAGEQPRKYVANETDEQILHTRVDGPQTQTSVHHITFVRTGEADGIGVGPLCCGDDFMVHMSFHFTLLPDGRVTAMPDQIRTECK